MKNESDPVPESSESHAKVLPFFRSAAGRYIVALLSLVVATGLIYILRQTVTARSPSYGLIILAALMVSAWYGYGPGIAALAVAAFGMPYLLTPGFKPSQTNFQNLGLVLLVSLLISRISATQARLRQTNEALDERVRRRTAELVTAQESIANTRDLLQTTLSSIGDGVITTDGQGLVLFLNPVAESLTGWSSGEAVGQKLEQVFHTVNEHTGAAVANPVVQVLRKGVTAGLANHTELISRTGVHIPIDDSAAPIRGDGNTVAGAVLVFRDITEKRRAERERAAILERIQDGFYALDRQWRYSYVNEEALKQTGKVREELLGRTVWEVFPQLIGSEFDRQCRRAFEERQAVRFGFEFDHRWFEGNAYPAEDGLTLFVRDLTAERQAAAATAKLVALVESSEDAIIAKTLEGVIESWNGAAERIYGHTAQEIIGKPISVLVPPDRLHEEPEIIARIRRGERVEHFETVRLRKDGSSIEVSLTISPIRNPCGEITGASHIARDITSRKQLDEHLRQTQKLESLGVLAGGIAHDFNNLLVGILGNASLAQDMVSEESRIRPILEGVVTASERAAQLTNQMLAYSGKGRFVIERKQIRDLVRETLPLIQASIPRTVQLELELEDAVAPVEVDVAQMQQLIMNLVINGAEAVPAGRPGAVTISASEVQVDEKYLRAARASNQIASGAYVCIAVRDTGAGMDEGTKARMFDPFFTTKFTGRGLGLAAVLGIVRGHKGFSIVDSTPGQGTTFRVFLPAAASSHVVSDTKRSTGGLAGSATVLVVDDEAIVRQLTTQVLQGHGHTVLVAENGEKGIEVFSEHASEINLVLLDLTMPVMSGEETFVAMKKLHPNVPIILSSGYSQLEATRRFEGKDVAGFLQKPYRSTTLVETVNEVIGHSKGGLAAG